MAEYPGLRPTEMVKHSSHVVDFLSDVYGRVGRRWRKPTLLVGGDVVTSSDIPDQSVQIIEGQARSSVEDQHRRPTAVSPAAQLLRRACADGERLAHRQDEPDGRPSSSSRTIRASFFGATSVYDVRTHSSTSCQRVLLARAPMVTLTQPERPSP